jgi:hypothetical protein
LALLDEDGVEFDVANFFRVAIFVPARPTTASIRAVADIKHDVTRRCDPRKIERGGGCGAWAAAYNQQERPMRSQLS